MNIYNYFKPEIIYLIINILVFPFVIVVLFYSIRYGIAAVKDIKTYLSQEKRKRDAYLYSDILMAVCISIGGFVFCFVLLVFSDVIVETKEAINDMYCQSTHQYITIEGDCSVDSVVKQYRPPVSVCRVILTIGDVTIKPDNYFDMDTYNKLRSSEKVRICYIVDGEKTNLYNVYDPNNGGEYCWTTDSTVLLIYDINE